MDLVHIWHDDRYWFKHFLITTTTWSRINRWYVHGVATCEWGGHDVMWKGCGHENETVSCEQDDHMWTKLCLFELVGHVWMGSFVNAVWSCERGGHMWTGKNSGYVWTAWSCMKGLWLCERGRRVNWVRCDTFYFKLLITSKTYWKSNRETYLYAGM